MRAKRGAGDASHFAIRTDFDELRHALSLNEKLKTSRFSRILSRATFKVTSKNEMAASQITPRHNFRLCRQFAGARADTLFVAKKSVRAAFAGFDFDS